MKNKVKVKFYKSYIPPYRVKGNYRSAVEEIIKPSFIKNEFKSIDEANEYARWIFGATAFAVKAE